MKTTTSLLMAVLTLAINACGEDAHIFTTTSEGKPCPTGEVCLTEVVEEDETPKVETPQPRIPAIAVPVEVKPPILVAAKTEGAFILIETALDAPQGPSAPHQGQGTGKWRLTNTGTKTGIISDFDIQDYASFACGDPCRKYLNSIYGDTAYGNWDLTRRPGESRGYDGWLTLGRRISLEPGQTKILILYEDTNGARSGDTVRVNLRNVRWSDENGSHTLPAPRQEWRTLTY